MTDNYKFLMPHLKDEQVSIKLFTHNDEIVKESIYFFQNNDEEINLKLYLTNGNFFTINNKLTKDNQIKKEYCHYQIRKNNNTYTIEKIKSLQLDNNYEYIFKELDNNKIEIIAHKYNLKYKTNIVYGRLVYNLRTLSLTRNHFKSEEEIMPKIKRRKHKKIKLWLISDSFFASYRQVYIFDINEIKC